MKNVASKAVKSTVTQSNIFNILRISKVVKRLLLLTNQMLLTFKRSCKIKSRDLF